MSSSGARADVSPVHLTLADGGKVAIEPVAGTLPAATAEPLAVALADMDPWRRYRFDVERLQRFIVTETAGAERYLLVVRAEITGYAVLKPGWMFGTYLNFLAVLPAHQGRGVGSAFLGWMEAEGHRRGERNQFVVTSAFNARGLALYRRHGFTPIADMPGLIAEDETEILLRKKLC